MKKTYLKPTVLFFCCTSVFFITLFSKANLDTYKNQGPFKIECWKDEESYQSRKDNPEMGLWQPYYQDVKKSFWHIYYSGDINHNYQNSSTDEKFIIVDGVKTNFGFSTGRYVEYNLENNSMIFKSYFYSFFPKDVNNYSFCIQDNEPIIEKSKLRDFHAWE